MPRGHSFLYGRVLGSKGMELLPEHVKAPAIGTYQINISIVVLNRTIKFEIESYY